MTFFLLGNKHWFQESICSIKCTVTRLLWADVKILFGKQPADEQALISWFLAPLLKWKGFPGLIGLFWPFYSFNLKYERVFQPRHDLWPTVRGTLAEFTLTSQTSAYIASKTETLTALFFLSKWVIISMSLISESVKSKVCKIFWKAFKCKLSFSSEGWKLGSLLCSHFFCVLAFLLWSSDNLKGRQFEKPLSFA